MTTLSNERISLAAFRAAHKALGHQVIGMPSAGAIEMRDGSIAPPVPAWAKCLTCEIVVDDV